MSLRLNILDLQLSTKYVISIEMDIQIKEFLIYELDVIFSIDVIHALDKIKEYADSKNLILQYRTRIDDYTNTVTIRVKPKQPLPKDMKILDIISLVKKTAHDLNMIIDKGLCKELLKIVKED